MVKLQNVTTPTTTENVSVTPETPVVTTAAYTKDGKTSKSKAVMGVPNNHKTIWSTFHLNREDWELAHNFRKAVAPEIDTQIFYGNVLIKWFNDNRQMMKETVLAKLGSTGVTAEDLQLKIDNMNRKLAEQTELLNRLMARQTPVEEEETEPTNDNDDNE